MSYTYKHLCNWSPTRRLATPAGSGKETRLGGLPFAIGCPCIRMHISYGGSRTEEIKNSFFPKQANSSSVEVSVIFAYYNEDHRGKNKRAKAYRHKHSAWTAKITTTPGHIKTTVNWGYPLTKIDDSTHLSVVLHAEWYGVTVGCLCGAACLEKMARL